MELEFELGLPCDVSYSLGVSERPHGQDDVCAGPGRTSLGGGRAFQSKCPLSECLVWQWNRACSGECGN